jgi:hypothetical protein
MASPQDFCPASSPFRFPASSVNTPASRGRLDEVKALTKVAGLADWALGIESWKEQGGALG